MKIVFRLSETITTAVLLGFAVVLSGCSTGQASPTPHAGGAGTAAITLQDFKLAGDLSGGHAIFTLTARAHVEDAKGGSADLLSGSVALMEIGAHPKWDVHINQGRFVATFEHGGDFPIQIKFSAAVRENDGWNALDFQVPPSVLHPIVLHGLAEDTKFQFPGAARPERAGNDFTSFLPSDGSVKLSWKEAKTEAEGKLFYAAEMRSQISVSQGLMRQTDVLDFKVMQGELSRVTLVLHGQGEVTGVQGDQVLAWNEEPAAGGGDRRLVVQLNQPQKDQFTFLVKLQTTLGAFPQTVDAIRLRPDGATRFAGYFRIVNEGAVRLEVAQASGATQISPDQFPQSGSSAMLPRPEGNQQFAYAFSTGDFLLRIQADQIFPELGVSELLAYNLGENELAIDTEFELDIREAPLRELLISIPKGYAVARLNAPGYVDYFVSDADAGSSELRVVYGQPVMGRQIVQLRLEHNQALGGTDWAPPRVEVVKAKSTRGYVAFSADPGFRLTPMRNDGLTEVAPALFPRRVPNIQAAYRLSDSPAWLASLRVERLPQTLTVDALHLFSIGEGVAYGSSVLNYQISGAPAQSFKVQLSGEYFNVEFTGRDLRNWQKTADGYEVHLQSPVAGAYTLLATYERPFKAQGETLTFTGVRPLDAQSEQGHTIITSAYQFQVKPQDVSAGLLPLETAEVPAEYRLFFDAPILAAYRYSSRPFNLQLNLSPLAQGYSLSQVVDRASLDTRISKEGQVVTEARYFVKNRGHPNLGVTLPDGAQLWSATVDGAAVVPVMDGKSNLIPLPQRVDPDAVLELDLKIASRSLDSRRVTISAPTMGVPVMLAQWKLAPDAGQRLVFVEGSLTPVDKAPDLSGFSQLSRFFAGDNGSHARMTFLIALLLVALALLMWRWAGRPGVARMSPPHIASLLIGCAAVVIAGFVLAGLAGEANKFRLQPPRELSFLAPVQQGGTALSVEVSNIADGISHEETAKQAWLALLAIVVWAAGFVNPRRNVRTAANVLGWLLLAWAALRSPNGAPAFLAVVAAYLLISVVLPTLLQALNPPGRPAPAPGGPIEGGASAATAAMIVGGLLLFFALPTAQAAPVGTPIAESVTQDIRIEDKFAIAKAKIHWQAMKGETLPILFDPAILTKTTFPEKFLKLVPAPAGSRSAQQVQALEYGAYDIDVQYELTVPKGANESGFTAPVPYGLINRLNLTVVNQDVDVSSPQAVSVQRETVGSNTVATIVLSPLSDARIVWKPRSRDVKHEKAVFYTEISQLYAPSAGVIEGAQIVAIRPAQGELSELTLDVPESASVIDVIDPQHQNVRSGSIVSLWRFDPDARKLRVTLNPPQSKPFNLVVRSQIPTGTLPLSQSIGLLNVEGAAGPVIGLLGLATGNEVQLDSVTAGNFSPINLEDFPNDVASWLRSQISDVTVRRAFRYSDAGAKVTVKASAVQPDVRVETQTTLSLGEDRTVLAATANVDIERAGIFRLSFAIPAGYDVEAISGGVLSHWTEAKADNERIITLHLNGKTQGQQAFSITLAGPGVKSAKGWTAPQIALREASKQRGTLLIVPEQGMRPQVVSRGEGITQMDPQQSGIQQKGVLAFRILQEPSTLTLDLDQVDPWIQVVSLEHVALGEAQMKVTANLQYQIENTGLKEFHVYLPANAENARFECDQISDFAKVDGAVTNGLQEWAVKLQRRVIGQHLLRVSFQTLLPTQANEAVLRGIEAADVNLQRGYVTVQAEGRLEARADALPEALQPVEWQSIPRSLLPDMPAAANFAWRLVQPSFQLNLKLQRHEAAKLLPARVNSVDLTSVVSDDGVMLTEARLEILPGDKRLLALELPKDAHFWFAFVNDNGAWPWRDKEQILIPLEQQSRTDKPVPVAIYYSAKLDPARPQSLAVQMAAPKFDLPLENVTWRVSLNEKWRVKDWSGALQLDSDTIVPRAAAVNLQSYLDKETALQQARTKEAEGFMASANSALQQGDPQQARRAFQAAYGLSTHDAAFNEDARVELHNIKLQEALVGLNVRQSANAGGGGMGGGGRLGNLRSAKEINYTQQDAKDMIDKNSAEDNAAFMRLAEKIIQQQDAAVASPAAIRATIAEQGRVLTFKRAVVVDPRADLNLRIDAAAPGAVDRGVRGRILLGTLLVLGVFGWAVRRPAAA